MASPTALLSAARSQLVLIDHQERLMPHIAGGDAVLANALRLAALATLFGVPAVGTEQTPAKLGRLPDALHAACSTVLAKTHFDACAEGLLDELAADRPQLVVAGCEAHVCLLQSTLGLLHEGHDVWLVADACGSRAASNRDLALQRLVAAGARLVSTEMVAFEWARDAQHPRFRELLALVK